MSTGAPLSVACSIEAATRSTNVDPPAAALNRISDRDRNVASDGAPSPEVRSSSIR